MFLAVFSWANCYSPRKCQVTVQGQHRLRASYTLPFPVCNEDEPNVFLSMTNVSCTMTVILMTREGDMASFDHRCSLSFLGQRTRRVCEDVMAGTDEKSSPLLGSTRDIAYVQVDVSVGVNFCWICGRQGVTAHSPPLPLQWLIWLANSTLSFHNFKWIFFFSSLVHLI